MFFRIFLLGMVFFVANVYPMQFAYMGRNATLIRTDSSGRERTVVVPQVRRNRSFALTEDDIKRVLDSFTPEERPVRR